MCYGATAGFCLTATQPDGGPSGWVNGYCEGTSVTPAGCGLAYVCFTGAGCLGFEPCPVGDVDAGQVTCHTGYVCEDLSRIFTNASALGPDPACVPNCHNAGWNCQPSTKCVDAGYCR
jgi:hypothetical protein